MLLHFLSALKVYFKIFVVSPGMQDVLSIKNKQTKTDENIVEYMWGQNHINHKKPLS